MEVEAYWARYRGEELVHLVIDGDVVCDVYEVPWGGRSPVGDLDGEKCPACESFILVLLELAIACKRGEVEDVRVPCGGC